MNAEFLMASDRLEEQGCPVADYLRRAPTFLTGSRAYGTPRYSSDVDVVVLMDEATIAVLTELLGCKDMRGLKSFKIGRLNLLATNHYGVWQTWRTVTDSLAARKPVTKAQAIAAFKEALGGTLNDQDDTSDWDDS